MGVIEVRKDDNSKTWYSGYIIDIGRSSSLKVGFEHDVWPPAEYAASSARKPPKLSVAEAERFNPRVGDEVELQIVATEHSPAGWTHAVVRNIKHGFYFVARTVANPSESTADAIVEKDLLRPINATTGFETAGIIQENFKLPPLLHTWMTTSDAVGCFGHIEEQTGLVHVQVQKGNLRLVGDAKAVMKAKLLLEVHVKHQSQIHSFQDVREKRLKALEVKRSRIEGSGYKHSIEIYIDASFIPRIIGKGGEAIRALQEKYDVSVRITDDDSAEGRVVRIFGNSLEQLEKTRAEVEFVEEAIALQPAMYKWVLGKGGKTIQAFKEASGLVYARLDRDADQLLLCGTRVAVEDATAMFETHLLYYPVFTLMDTEMEEILSQLEEHGDYKARWEWSCYKDEVEEEPQQERGHSRGKAAAAAATSKGTGRSKQKSGASQDEWLWYANDEAQEEASAVEVEAEVLPKGKGRGRRATRAAPSADRQPAKDDTEAKPLMRKMGKKGVRGEPE